MDAFNDWWEDGNGDIQYNWGGSTETNNVRNSVCFLYLLNISYFEEIMYYPFSFDIVSEMSHFQE
jgi:hypothetical protein